MMGGIRGNYCKGCDKHIADCTCESTRATTAPDKSAAQKLYESWQHAQPGRCSIPPWNKATPEARAEWEALAAREPAPVARELDADALDKAGDAWGDKVIAEEKRIPRWGEAFDAGAKWVTTQATAESAPASAAPDEQQEITRLDVLSLIREHTHRCYVAGVNMDEIDPKYAQEIEDALKRLVGAAPREAESQIPAGWQFNTADFSCLASGRHKKGNVTLVRDAAGRAEFNALCQKENFDADAFQLYIYGSGATLREAIADAVRIIPSNSSPAGAKEQDK